MEKAPPATQAAVLSGLRCFRGNRYAAGQVAHERTLNSPQVLKVAGGHTPPRRARDAAEVFDRKRLRLIERF